MTDQLASRVRREILAGTHVDAATRHNTKAVGVHELHSLTRSVRADLYGAGPLQQLLEVPGITDVLVNGPRDVWIDRGKGLEQTALDLGSESQVRALAVRLAASAGRRLDDAEPAVDARLRDGVRLHAILPPLAPQGTTLSLRIPTPRPLTLDDLVEQRTVSPNMAQVLRQMLESRSSFIICGATGTGKTTLLGALLAAVDPRERLVIIEEAQELSPDHRHVVHLQTRVANVEGVGEITLSTLVRHALRMRPDRIVLGESRGAEIRELLTAFNTGHEGGGTTLHANTPADVPARIAALGALAGMDRFAIAAQTASALKVLIHLRHENHERWISEIGLIKSSAPGELDVIPAWSSPAPGVEQERAGSRELTELWEGR